MESVRKIYKEAFSLHGDSPSSVLWPKGRQDQRFFYLLKDISREFKGSLLDFGCGLGHLKPFLNDNYPNIEYNGVDIVEEFIDINKKKYPESNFFLMEKIEDIKSNYDIILISGTFNVQYFPSLEKHKQTVFQSLSYLFNHCNVLLSCNFMTDAVDFMQPNSYHQNPNELLDFIAKKMSPRVNLLQSYMPYEYTIQVYKDINIIRPDNIYYPVSNK